MLKKIANGNNATIGQYTYDINGVRYRKTAGGVTTTYFYNGNTLLGENRSDGKQLRYFYDATGLCGFSCKDGLFITYYTYVKDVLGNIVMIKSDMGALLAKYTYDEWGNCTVENIEGTIGNINPFRYRGYYYDTESGLYYLMSRYYDPQIGQFISMDTPDYLDPETIGGVDLYAYCRNNPVMYVDPSGHSVIITVMVAILIGFTILGGVLGGIAAANNSENEASAGDIALGVIKGATLGFSAGLIVATTVGVIWALSTLSPHTVVLAVKKIVSVGIAFYNIGLAIFGGFAAVEVQLIEMGGGQESPPAWPPTTTGG